MQSNFNFVKGVPIIYVNIIIILSTVAGKNRMHCFHTDICSYTYS